MLASSYRAIKNVETPVDDPERTSIDEDADNEFPPPRRPVRPAVIVGIIVLVVLVVAGGIFATTRFVGGSANTLPTPTLVPGSNLFYVQTSPAWGNFFVDGQQLAHMPTNPAVDLPLQLSAGIHQVTWQADPFIQHCVIIVPPAVSQTKCLANDPVPIQKGPNKGLNAYLITFAVSFNDLTPAQQQPLFQATQKALDALQSSDTVQPGEKYVDMNAPGFISTATTTLRATLRYQLDTNTGAQGACAGLFFGPGPNCSINGQDCHLLCDADQTQAPPGEGPKVTPGRWNVFAVVRSNWTYTMLNGQIVAQNQPDEADNLGTEYLFNLYVSYTNGQWQVSTKSPENPTNFIVSSPSCEAADYLVMQTGYNTYSGINLPGNPDYSINWNTGDGSNAAAGCLLVALAIPPQNNNPTPTPIVNPKPFAHCLYRFGVLLALDSAAHTLWPNLPVADAYEQGVAQHIKA
jgi:hypothetical protein